MRLLLLTAGTRGDVEPFAVLARRAARDGHTVTLGVPDGSGLDLSGLDARSLDVDFRPLIQDQGVSPLLAVRAFRSFVRPAMGRLLDRALRLVLDTSPDVVLAHPKVLTAPLGAAELRIPFFWVETVPSWTATSEFPAPGVLNHGVGAFNRHSYRVAAAAGLMFRREIAAAVANAGIGHERPPKASGSLVPASPHILARPHDWPATTHLTGAWTAPGPHVPSGEVQRFTDGAPFVYAGFGSMAAGSPEDRARAVVDAARDLGLRTLIATGWGGLSLPRDRAGGDVLQVDDVDHRAVFPLASAAIYHGGAGTVHAAAAAGVPSLVVPFVADQPFWGRQLAARGLAPDPIPYRRLTRERLRPALAQALELREAAARVGALIRSEDGPGEALRIIATPPTP